MNIIRTPAVELNTIPAIAYKQKLSSGGAGLRILRLDRDAVAIFTLDRRSGEALPYGSVDGELFPHDAVDEALELTGGMPYSSRGKIVISVFSDACEDEDVRETDADKIDMVDSPEYKAIIERYCDEKGKLNYTLMNKDFIQFAAKSQTVAKMIAERVPVDDILPFVIQSRAAFISGEKDSLSPEQTAALIETLDEIDPRSAFKELKQYLRRMAARH